MNSIVTNTAAISTLSSLRAINASMSETQAQISSGLRVETAADNAAYWSIGTTMRSDNKALGAVVDAMNLGSATVDVAYAAMESTVDILDEIKARLTAASEPGVDRSKVQKEIDQLQDQLQSVIDSASFNGENWLKANGTSADVLSTTIVSGFTRDEDGNVALQTLDVDLADTVLLNDSGGGLLQFGDGSFEEFGGFVDAYNANGFFSPGTFTGPFKVSSGDSLSFDIGGPSLPTYTVTIDRDTVDAALGSEANGTIFGVSDMATVVNYAIVDAGGSLSDAQVYVTGSNTFYNVSQSGLYEMSPNLSVVDSGADEKVSIMDMTIAGTSGSLEGQIGMIETMLQSTTDAAADLGAMQSRLERQTAFTNDLMDSLDKGIGTLVDADMNETSTRLKALQTQQQLSIQALSIANSSSQALMQLFQ